MASRRADPGSSPPTTPMPGTREKRGTGWRRVQGPPHRDLRHPRAGHRPGAALNLITNVATTAAPVPDAAMTEPVHDMLAAAGPGPRRARRRRRATPARTCCWPPGPAASPCSPRCPPMPPRRPAPAATPRTCSPSTGTHQQVTCPQGAAQPPTGPPPAATAHDGLHRPVPRRRLPGLPGPRQVHHLSPARPAAGPAPPRDPRSRHRRPRRARPPRHWKDRYDIRAGVEGTIRQATAVTGIRTARYLGLPKTSLEHAAAAAAINLTRLNASWTSNPLDRPTAPPTSSGSTSPPPPKPNKPTESPAGHNSPRCRNTPGATAQMRTIVSGVGPLRER